MTSNKPQHIIINQSIIDRLQFTNRIIKKMNYTGFKSCMFNLFSIVSKWLQKSINSVK